MQFDTSDVILYVLAFFLPPFPILIRVGFCTNQFLLNILLTMLFGVPGTLHALYIVYITSPITGSPERRVRNYDYERVVENDGEYHPINNGAYSSTPNQIHQHHKQQSQPNNTASSSTQPFTLPPPPPYDDSTNYNRESTDNKVQKS